MKQKTASEARQNFSEMVNHVAFGGERVVIHRHGKELAAVVPMEEVSILHSLESHMDLSDAKLALKEAQESGTVSFEELKQQLGF